jgi:hypothetical protein
VVLLCLRLVVIYTFGPLTKDFNIIIRSLSFHFVHIDLPQVDDPLYSAGEGGRGSIVLGHGWPCVPTKVTAKSIRERGIVASLVIRS